ncbi:molybdopterin-dependent oxidoreductase [Candidatus Aalborgicola defluviihabitans]|uniref:molybdopterin-dependent oxidoreductase n=1 Tax=Candidatus Aalborgicola defluviihabitans TaxID=3386187 RepID=UPI0039B86FBE
MGGITSGRCTNEEVHSSSEVDPCGVWHQHRGHLRLAFAIRPRDMAWVRPSNQAGTQTFKSVEQADVIMTIGANPTDAHPVFASRMKRSLARRRAPDRRGPTAH